MPKDRDKRRLFIIKPFVTNFTSYLWKALWDSTAGNKSIAITSGRDVEQWAAVRLSALVWRKELLNIRINFTFE